MTDLLPAPLVGFRRWRVGCRGKLWPAGWVPDFGFGVDPSWPDDRDYHAECRRASHRAPDWSCGCGLHAYYGMGVVPVGGGEVRGAIVAWGRVILHETGFRAEWARIVAFAAGTPPHVAERYGCPALATDELVEYAGWFGERAATAGNSLV